MITPQLIEDSRWSWHIDTKREGKNTHISRRAGALLCLVLYFVCPLGLGDKSSGDDLRATFLFNFARLTHWPNDKLKTKPPLSICYHGDTLLGRALKQFEGSKAKGRRVTIQQALDPLNQPQPCDIFFIAGLNQADTKKMVRTFIGQPVLTVSEAEGFAACDGHIEFKTNKKNNIELIVNTDRIKQSDLSVSSRILMRSKVIHSMKCE